VHLGGRQVQGCHRGHADGTAVIPVRSDVNVWVVAVRYREAGFARLRTAKGDLYAGDLFISRRNRPHSIYNLAACVRSLSQRLDDLLSKEHFEPANNTPKQDVLVPSGLSKFE
jgi:hypothetical protein